MEGFLSCPQKYCFHYRPWARPQYSSTTISVYLPLYRIQWAEIISRPTYQRSLQLIPKQANSIQGYHTQKLCSNLPCCLWHIYYKPQKPPHTVLYQPFFIARSVLQAFNNLAVVLSSGQEAFYNLTNLWNPAVTWITHWTLSSSISLSSCILFNLLKNLKKNLLYVPTEFH